MKNLIDAGTTIKASPDQFKRLRVGDANLNSLLTVSETGQSSIDEKEVDLSLILDSASASEAEPTSKTAVSEAAESEDEEDVDNITEADAHLLGKFVDLCDLLPPLPKKGTFDVETIKKSQYFFS